MLRHLRFIASSMLFCLLSSWSYADKLLLTIESAQGKDKGVVTIRLRADKSPKHVARIARLVEEGRYNGVVFHRVIDDFMAQTGDVEFGNIKKLDRQRVGQGGSTYDDLKAELSDIAFVPGIVGMARSRYIHSANSQFFIMIGTQPGLNGQYTVVGEVTGGLDIVLNIKKGLAAQNGTVAMPDIIKTAVIIKE